MLPVCGGIAAEEMQSSGTLSMSASCCNGATSEWEQSKPQYEKNLPAISVVDRAAICNASHNRPVGVERFQQQICATDGHRLRKHCPGKSAKASSGCNRTGYVFQALTDTQVGGGIDDTHHIDRIRAIGAAGSDETGCNDNRKTFHRFMISKMGL